jgi:transposase
MQITTIGLDIAKNVFQVHGIDAAEKVVVRKQLRRAQVMKFFAALPRCLVGMEACATAHYWARELTRLGHQVRLMPAKDVKAYVKRNKNDAADAAAICEAVRRPTMRFVEVKSAEQQGRLMQHRTRDLLMRQRTQTINALRAHLAELGIVAAQGREGLKQLLEIIADKTDERLPIDARASLIVLAAQLQALQTIIGVIERRIIAQHRANEASKRVATIPGIGFLGASAITATVTDASAFRSGRDFAAWIGLVPRQDSTGANRSLDRFPSRATATCGAFLSSERTRYCGSPRRTRRTIPGWRSCWRDDRSRWWPLRSPTRWLASPGCCWPVAARIARLSLRQRNKRTSNGRMRLRPCVS